MTQKRDFFTPKGVDEQIEQFSSRLPLEPAHLEQDDIPVQAETGHETNVSGEKQNYPEQDASTRLVRELQAYYEAEYQQNQAFLAHARRRIVAHRLINHDPDQARTPAGSAPVLRFSQERTRIMQSSRSTDHSPSRRLSRGLGLVAAVLVAGLLVGTLAVVLALGHSQQNNQTLGGKKATATSVATPTPTPVSAGTIRYTWSSPAGQQATSPAWSPDGTRVAVPTADQKTLETRVYILDAASGKQLMTISLATGSLNEILWSPTGKYLALDNLQTIVIVDSQTGSVVKTINYQRQTAFNFSDTSQPQLSSQAPLGSGYGFYSVAWTPDGKSLAVAISYFTSGKVVLLDPVTGAVKVTFKDQASSIGLALAFSSDGKYLAANYANDSKVVVWNVATQQVTWVLNGGQAANIAWQPGTHHLARGLVYPDAVQLWDVSSNKLLKTYKGLSSFAWSPDGKELATYGSFMHQIQSVRTKNNKVTILNASTGAQVGSYASQNDFIFSVSWSPNGRYLAATEALANHNKIVVWNT